MHIPRWQVVHQSNYFNRFRHWLGSDWVDSVHTYLFEAFRTAQELPNAFDGGVLQERGNGGKHPPNPEARKDVVDVVQQLGHLLGFQAAKAFPSESVAYRDGNGVSFRSLWGNSHQPEEVIPTTPKANILNQGRMSRGLSTRFAMHLIKFFTWSCTIGSSPVTKAGLKLGRIRFFMSRYSWRSMVVNVLLNPSVW